MMQLNLNPSINYKNKTFIFNRPHIQMKQREQIIHNYISAYNHFDIDAMLATLDPEIMFQNVAQGNVTMTIEGLGAFRMQAEKARDLFSERRQEITHFNHTDHETETSINYSAILAVDLSNELKKGNKLELKGKSIFRFFENRIVAITDIS